MGEANRIPATVENQTAPARHFGAEDGRLHEAADFFPPDFREKLANAMAHLEIRGVRAEKPALA